eukprot:TRINITY_DN620_c0_g2_i2.p1 TRINITY_DN620_c0_g2~~TRINITY_DN620_c0_g2_i2.p1  ORF type:complete len:160 (+),score=26.87 TRINITY_DN620_c0_g2_i2:526-1005(+)
MMLVHEALPHLMNTSGKILYNSSMSAYYGVPKLSLYNSSKIALHRFFDCLRMELPKGSVGITIACPGLVNTEKAATYIPETDMKQSMDARKCALQMLEACAKGQREIRMNLIDSPPISGELVYLLVSLFPSLADWILAKAYEFQEKSGGIRDAIETPPS